MRPFALAILALLLAAVPASPMSGTFALQGATQKTNGYLTIAQLGTDRLDRRISTYFTKAGSATALRAYDVDMTKLLHMIVVSDDFKTFIHIHPQEQRDGRFSIDQRLPSAAMYHIYDDAQPTGFGQQVFRFDVPLGQAAPARDLSETATMAKAGPYTVTISTRTLSAAKESMLTIHVRKHGTPAKDLHPYLGALAHAVFLNANDLSYVHVHPLPAGSAMNDADMSGMGSMHMDAPAITDPSAPDMTLHVELREAGTYKLWLQFRGGSQLYVAPFVLQAN